MKEGLAVFRTDTKHQLKVSVYEAWRKRPAGIPFRRAEAEIAERFCLSVSSVRRYIKEIEQNGYLPLVKPSQGRSVYAWDAEALQFLRSFFLDMYRKVGFCSRRNAYNATCKEAKLHGWRVGSEPSAYKHLAQLHPLLIEYVKGGRRALDNYFYIARDLSHLAPFEVIVGDQHIFDWWVINDKGEEFRPECYAWIDMRTRLPYGISFEAGPYNFRTVARSLREGLIRFGKFNSTYNDNGKPETAHKITWLVEALQTFGMKYTDESELYKTEDGRYVIEDDTGAVIAVTDHAEAWRKKNRRIFAEVKNAKTKPIERFFRTLEVLLLDQCLPGAVRDLTLSAAEDEEASRRLAWQKANGFLLHYNEFILQVQLALEQYEMRVHSSLKCSPRDELMKAVTQEGWLPTRIAPSDLEILFLEPSWKKVRNNRVVVDGITFVGPPLTQDMVKLNHSNLAGLQGQKIEVRYNPEHPEHGAYAINPVSHEVIFLTPEKKIDFFNQDEVEAAIAEKRRNMKAVTDAFFEQTKGFGHVLTSTRYKPLEHAKERAEKAVLEDSSSFVAPCAALPDKRTPSSAAFCTADSLSPEAFAEAVSARLQTVLKEGQKARPVYASERERYTAIIDALIAGSSLCDADMAFKVRYEQTLSEEDAVLFENKIRFAFAQKKEY